MGEKKFERRNVKGEKGDFGLRIVKNRGQRTEIRDQKKTDQKIRGQRSEKIERRKS